MLLHKTIGQVLEESALKFPDNDALVYVDRGLRYSYSEFNKRCDKLARGLMSLGIKKGDKVGVWAYNVPHWVFLQFALAKMGAVLVTINTYYKSHELEYLLRQSDTNTLFLVQGFKDVDYVRTLNKVIPELEGSVPGQLRVDKLPYLKNVVFMDGDPPSGMLAYDDIINRSERVSVAELARRKDTLDPFDVINMQYTSGTTGFPKGVMLTHHNVVNNAFFIGQRQNLTENDRYLIPVPFFHCFGCVLSTLNCVVVGATMIPIEIFDPLKCLQAVHKEKCTAINGVPTMFIAELQHPDFDQYTYDSLRTGIMAGSTCPEEVMKQVQDKMTAHEIVICYGLTETSPVLTETFPHDSMERRTSTVGRPLPQTEVKIVDPDTGKELQPNIPGELIARGYCVMKGYYKNDEATNASIRNGWLHSKDLATMDEDGYFKILGRVDDMIIRGGENVYPREIEEFLYTHPDVKYAAVVGVPSKKYGEEIMAFIQLKEIDSVSEDELKAYCLAHISRFKVPKYLAFVDSYPMTASGKIQKYKLREIGTAMISEKE